MRKLFALTDGEVIYDKVEMTEREAKLKSKDAEEVSGGELWWGELVTI